MSDVTQGNRLTRRSLLKTVSVGSGLLAGATLAGVGTPRSAAAAGAKTAEMIAARAAPAVVQTEVIRGLFGTDSPLDEEMLRAEGEAFEELTGVRFEFQTEGANLFDRVATLVAGQSDEFDIYHSHYAQIGRYLGGFYPLNEYAERDGVEADQFIGGSFDALTVDEQLLAIPMRVDVRGFYYRTDIFEEAGIAAPPATRDELVEIALATNNPPGIYGYATVGRGDPALREFSDLLWENGGDFLENGLDPRGRSSTRIPASRRCNGGTT